MRIHRLIPFAVLLTALAFVGPARAGYSFQFADSSGTVSNAFTINTIGGTVDIRVYLTQSGPDTLLSSQGLVSAGVQVNNSNGAAAQVQTTGDITPSAAWDSSSSSTSPSQSKLNLFQDSGGPPVIAPTSGSDANRILLGTFRFTGLSQGTTKLATADPSPFDDTVTANGIVLDSLIQNVNAQITVVPEPGSFVLGGLVAASLGWGAWRRWRRQRSAVV